MANRKTSAEKHRNGQVPPIDGNGVVRQAAYFLSLSLENVRCFGPKQTLDLSDGHGKPAPWTIILGLNGTGKTTVLQTLVGFDPAMLNLVPADPKPSEWGSFLKRFHERVHSFRRSNHQQPSNWSTKVSVSNSLHSAPRLVTEYPFQVGRIGTLILRPEGEPAELPWCCGYGASRRMGVVSLVGTATGAEAESPTSTLFSDSADLLNPEEWLLRLDYAVAKESEEHKQRIARLTQAKEVLLGVMPDDEITNIRFVTAEGTNPTSRVEFKTPYGWVPLRQLGYGYQTLITWVADFANRMVERYPNSPNPLAEPAVCLVDEIDLHLHPVWQRKLMGFLTERFPNTQFIATAHSPLVAQSAAEANLAVLRREDDHVVIDNDVDNIRNWRVDQILTSDLFGLKTAWPQWMESLMEERKAILMKPKPTMADERRLKQLEEKIGDLPVGQTAQEVKEMDQIRRTLELLNKERRPSK